MTWIETHRYKEAEQIINEKCERLERRIRSEFAKFPDTYTDLAEALDRCTAQPTFVRVKLHAQVARELFAEKRKDRNQIICILQFLFDYHVKTRKPVDEIYAIEVNGERQRLGCGPEDTIRKIVDDLCEKCELQSGFADSIDFRKVCGNNYPWLIGTN